METEAHPVSQIDKVITRLKIHVQNGSKVFWVCPLLEPNQALPFSSANERYQQLSSHFPSSQVFLLHGMMNAEEKDSALMSFASGSGGILVATTVVEVGVNVPDASICVIERAERFGLAQIHQIRGRIGRGDPPPSEILSNCYCLLLYSEQGAGSIDDADGALEKLNILLQSNDGFEIAEFDLNYRREGDFFGLNQHGSSNYKVFTVKDHAHIFEQARKSAELLLSSDWGCGKSDEGVGKLLLQTLFNFSKGSEQSFDASPSIFKKSKAASTFGKLDSTEKISVIKDFTSASTSIKDFCLVAFDLETTGLKWKNNRIIQIAAKVINDRTAVFNRYVLPNGDVVSDRIEELTGISQSFLEDEGVPVETALQDFVLWLREIGSHKPLVLVAHNGKSFDVPFLAAEFSRIPNYSWIQDANIFGFIDSFVILKNRDVWDSFSSMPTSLKLGLLYQFVTGKSALNAHNAIADVLFLEEILESHQLKHSWMLKAPNQIFTVEYTS